MSGRQLQRARRQVHFGCDGNTRVTVVGWLRNTLAERTMEMDLPPYSRVSAA